MRYASPACRPRSRTSDATVTTTSAYRHRALLDQFSLIAANLLVGNPERAAGLECAYTGPELVFSEPSTVAVTGAELEPRINGEARPAWTSFGVQAGDVMTFGHLKAAPACTWRCPAESTCPRSSAAAPPTDSVPWVVCTAGRCRPTISWRWDLTPRLRHAERSVPAELRPTLAMELEIRVIMGLYDHLLTDRGRSTFLETSWKLTPVADRVGFRYKGEKLKMLEREQPFGAGSDPSNIVDAPYPVGSIQVPGGVEPIVLHRDAVSGGGYAMIATVISADMDAVAQSAPGSQTRFRARRAR